MKKYIFILGICICFLMGITINAEEAMKISMDGEVKEAKEVNTGKDISFILPEFTDNEYMLSAIELAVFEKTEYDSYYHIYKDDNGVESKKRMIEEPDSYTIMIDFGNLSDYREKAKYKIAYRYYATALSDISVTSIVNEDVKDGWVLVGEDNPEKATNEGFTFYLNSPPEVNVSSFTYTKHTAGGDMVFDCNESELSDTVFPMDVFENGVIVQMSVNDYDREDILKAVYVLKDADTGEVLKDDSITNSPTITADIKTADRVSMQITVKDNFGGEFVSAEYIFEIDRAPAYVTAEFDDGGYYIRGERLFSDFSVSDNNGEKLIGSEVTAVIYSGDEEYSTVNLSEVKDGVYRLDVSNVPDGEYTVILSLFDKSGNVSEHTFVQKLDSTPPTAKFLSKAEYTQATEYSKWINYSGRLVYDATDELSGVKRGKLFQNDVSKQNLTLPTGRSSYRFNRVIDDSITGKIKYKVVLHDDAKAIDTANNKYLSSDLGNSSTYLKEVWIDKTKPVIEANQPVEAWNNLPYTFEATFNDYPSADGAGDASGIKKKLYAITDSETVPENWEEYTEQLTFTEGGIYFVHLKAVDNAGNESLACYKTKLNSKSEILGIVSPANDYLHTIYYKEPKFYVVKNTAYNTKYHFALSDNDVNDRIIITLKLASRDNRSNFAKVEAICDPTGDTVRDVVFNLSYINTSLDTLSDGVYDMYLTITEEKNGESLTTHENVNVCEIVIKRQAPPAPVIEVADGKVKIEYPLETLSGSLNTDKIRDMYKCEYKEVIEDDISSNVYKTYIGEFDARNSTVTALYTDIAGNISTATLRIHGIDEDGDGDGGSIITDGNTTVIEESRAANVYYIGIRRKTTGGIDSNIFDFLGDE